MTEMTVVNGWSNVVFQCLELLDYEILLKFFNKDIPHRPDVSSTINNIHMHSILFSML